MLLCFLWNKQQLELVKQLKRWTDIHSIMFSGDTVHYLLPLKCHLKQSSLPWLQVLTNSSPLTSGGVRDPSCHQLDAEHPICSGCQPPRWRAGGHLPIRHDTGLGASWAHAHRWWELLPLVGGSVRQHQSGDCSFHALKLQNALKKVSEQCTFTRNIKQVMSNHDRRPCHNKDFLRYNNIINGADWHNVPGSKNECF